MNIRFAIFIMASLAASVSAQICNSTDLHNLGKINLSLDLEERCKISISLTDFSGELIGMVRSLERCDLDNWKWEDFEGNRILTARRRPSSSTFGGQFELLDCNGLHLATLTRGKVTEGSVTSLYRILEPQSVTRGYARNDDTFVDALPVLSSNGALMFEAHKQESSTRYNPKWQITFMNNPGDPIAKDPRTSIALSIWHALINSPPAKDVEYGLGFGLTVLPATLALIGVGIWQMVVHRSAIALWQQRVRARIKGLPSTSTPPLNNN